MRTSITQLFLFFLFAAPLLLRAQPTSDGVVPLAVQVQTSPPQVQLSWNEPAGNNAILLFRREKNAPDWYVLIADSLSTATSFVDTLVEVGKTYEYGIQRLNNGWLYAYGYVTVPIEAPLTEQRGTLLAFVEEALLQPLESELDRLGRDLIGDGWRVVWHSVPAGATVGDVKNQIVADYNSGDFPNINSVLLFGNIPVPYSGNTNWDGHADHAGAWPADVYYGDVNFAWPDATVNNSTPARPENKNVPGDGKFDPSSAPTETELAVGRVDFSNLDEATWGTTRVELYRRYLNKNHNWRSKLYTVENKALVDDNFGFFGGEAFAANGYRNGYPLVGVNNVTEGDFFTDTDSKSFLFAYGCGGGTYTSASGVGSSTNFATDSINAVFTMIFGSYHGDWDYSPNPFMTSALASKGGILSCSWAGRPHWFSHHLGAGETLGYTALATQNACDNPGYFGSFGECGAHVSLLGDPTLRAQIVAPAQDVAAVGKCTSVELTWAAAADASTVLGYHVYRSAQFDGEFERLTSEPVAGTSFSDASPLDGEQVYMVRAVVLEQTPSGKFFNASTGAFATIDFSVAAAPSMVATGGTLDCNQTSVELTSVSDVTDGEYEWTSPTGQTFFGQNLTVNQAGDYSVKVTDPASGCTASTEVTVFSNTNPPGASASVAHEITCVQTTCQVLGVSPAPGVTYHWSGPGGFSSSQQSPTVSVPGQYLLTVTGANGCTSTASANLLQNTTPPNVSAQGTTLDCAHPEQQLSGNSNTLGATFNWTGPDAFTSNQQNPVVTSTGDYLLQVTDPANGCSATATASVTGDFAQPQASATGGILTCASSQIQLAGNSGTPGATFNWTGPNGFVSSEQNPMVSAAGEYILLVTDPANGCSETAVAQVTASGDVPVASPQGGTITCNEPMVTLFANPNAAGYAFQWAGANGFNSDLQNPVVDEPGVYVLTVTNPATGCSATYSAVVVENTTLPTISLPSVELTCAFSSFAVDCLPNPGLTCTWLDPAGNELPLGTIISSPGIYVLVLTDAATGCTTSADLLVSENVATPDLEVQGDLSINCYGETTTLTAVSNAPGAQFFWVGNVAIPIHAEQTVTAGTFTVIVTDASNGCTAIQEVQVTQPPLLTVSVVLDEVNCDGSLDILGVSAGGGTPPYSVEFTPGMHVPANTAYSITVTDANGCTWTTQGMTGNSSDLGASITQHTDESVFGANDGSAAAQGWFGTPPYEYLWNNGATIPIIANLSPGTYTCTVTDAIGCTATTAITILPGEVAATEIPGLRLLALSPNPTAGQFELSLELENAAEISVVLQDLTGRILEKTAVENAAAGSWRFDLSGYPAGVYFCKIQVDGGFAALRVVKM